MPISPDAMRILLWLSLLGMVVIAVLFLKGRKLPVSEFIVWGMLAVLLPVVGPFFVILVRPRDQRALRRLERTRRRASGVQLNPNRSEIRSDRGISQGSEGQHDTLQSG